MAIIYQTDKRSGITYAYEARYHWVIGRVDKKTGEIIPTDGRMKKSRDIQSAPPAGRGPAPAPCSSRSFYGATYLFDAIGEKLGITQDLKSCFPDTYKQILSIVYYLILEDNNPLSRFEKWGNIHKHPYGKDISSQRSSELFMDISEDAKNKFFSLQGKRRTEKEFWAYDTTSLSSYSETLRQVQFGNNKEDDRLPQINLALHCPSSERSWMPCMTISVPLSIIAKNTSSIQRQSRVNGFTHRTGHTKATPWRTGAASTFICTTISTGLPRIRRTLTKNFWN